jgi:hypothetical protein
MFPPSIDHHQTMPVVPQPSIAEAAVPGHATEKSP